MGILADLFVASPADAITYEAARSTPAADAFERVAFAGAAPPEFARLWALVEGRPADDDDGPALEDETPPGATDSWLYRFPDPFVKALAALDDNAVQSLARQWGALEELADADPAAILRALLGIRALAISAIASGRGLHLWGAI